VRRGQSAPGAHVRTSVARPCAVSRTGGSEAAFSAHCDELDEDELEEPVSYWGFAVTHAPVVAAFSS
jgi:hypothetical protein